MTKLFSIILLVFTTAICHAQETISFDFTSEDDNRLIKEDDSGKYYVASGDTTNIVCINDENQTYTLFNKAHRMITFGSITGDGDKFSQTGKWTMYYNNGKVKVIGNFYRNKPIGIWEEYYPDGKLKSSYNYAPLLFKNNNYSCMAGSYSEYYNNGKIKMTGFYAADLDNEYKDTIWVDEPVNGGKVPRVSTKTKPVSEKTGHWEYYTEEGELEKKEDF